MANFNSLFEGTVAIAINTLYKVVIKPHPEGKWSNDNVDGLSEAMHKRAKKAFAETGIKHTVEEPWCPKDQEGMAVASKSWRIMEKFKGSPYLAFMVTGATSGGSRKRIQIFLED